jgi:hypothetical protein
MPEATQTYRNHVRLRPAFHFFALPVLIANMFVVLGAAIDAPSTDTAWSVLVAAALVVLALSARGMALSVQDRIIRLEMRLRLREILPPDLQPRIHELRPRHLVAMRFASDGEMPELMRDVLGGSLDSQKAIKMRVKDWQADWLRV